MARNHARILTRIWRDPEFRALTTEAQHAYFTALSYPELSYVGVMDYMPKRLAAMSSGNTERRMTSALGRLAAARFVLIDTGTDELLIRSFVRNDGVMERVNMGKAVARAFDKIISLDLREALKDELARLLRDAPGLKGWAGFAEINPDAMSEIEAIASRRA